MLALRFGFWGTWPAGFVFGHVLIATIESLIPVNTIESLVPINAIESLIPVNTIEFLIADGD